MNLELQITSILGWCSIINIFLLFLAFIMITFMHEWISNLHAKLFHLNQSEIAAMYFQYLGQYKLLILVFNLVPYIALKILS